MTIVEPFPENISFSSVSLGTILLFETKSLIYKGLPVPAFEPCFSPSALKSPPRISLILNDPSDLASSSNSSFSFLSFWSVFEVNSESAGKAHGSDFVGDFTSDFTAFRRRLLWPTDIFKLPMSSSKLSANDCRECNSTSSSDFNASMVDCDNLFASANCIKSKFYAIFGALSLSTETRPRSRKNFQQCKPRGRHWRHNNVTCSPVTSYM